MDDRKHIAVFISSFRAGGGEKMMVEIAEALSGLGHRVDLVVMKNTGALSGDVSGAVNVVDLGVGRIIFSWIKLRNYLRQYKPNSIIALDEYTHLATLLAVRDVGYKVRVVLRIGNMYSVLFNKYKRFRDKLIPFLIKKFYRGADRVIAVSHGVFDDIVKLTNLDPEKVSVIYNPKRGEVIAQKKEFPVGHVWVERKDSLPLVVAVGRLREQKNFELLIKAFAEVKKEVNSRLVIVGMGREEGRLRELIRSLGCEDSVSLPGYTDNPYRFLSRADVFVSASLWEGMPNGVLEAITCGAPAIVSDCDSGPREILAPNSDYKFRLKKGFELTDNGILFAVNDEEALIGALGKMLKDQNLRSKYAKASLIRAKDFDMEKIIKQYEAVLLN